jgi:hypothetical protein
MVTVGVVGWVAIGNEALQAYMPSGRMAVGASERQPQPILDAGARTLFGEYSRVGFVKEVREKGR